MRSKKPTKSAKKPGKPTQGKAGHKAAAPKRAARPLLKHTPIATSKGTEKPNKPMPKPAAAKPAVAKPAAVKATHAKPTPVKPVAVKPAPVKPGAAAPDSKSHEIVLMNDHTPRLTCHTRP